jgi:predicted nucleotidyltransferase
VKTIPREALCAWAQRTRSIAALYVFGSYARDEATDTSDLDIALELAPDDGKAESELIEHAQTWKVELTVETGIRVKDLYLASDPCTAGKVLIFKRTPRSKLRLRL